MSAVPSIDVDTVAAATGDDLRLDVREAAEFAAGHAPGALHVALGDLPDHLDRLPRGRRIVCICRSGNRSTAATQFLVAEGFDAVNLTGGMQAWAAAGHPVVTAAGGTGQVA